MAAEPADRFPDMEAFAAALEPAGTWSGAVTGPGRAAAWGRAEARKEVAKRR